MPARIRLRRMGRKKQPHYRVVVADSTSPRDGRFIETLGYYKPLSSPARLVLDLERVDHWLTEGALPSGTVESLIAKARRGGDAKVALGEVDPETRETKRAEALAVRRAEEARTAQAKAEAEAAAATAETEAVAGDEGTEGEASETDATEAAAEEPAATEAPAEEPAAVEAAAEEPAAAEAAAEEPAAAEAAAEEPAAVEEPEAEKRAEASE